MIAWLVATVAFGQSETLLEASVVVAVTQREEAADAMVAQAVSLGGWFQSRTPDALSLRVPVDQAEALMTFAASQGKVVERTLQRNDASQELADLRGRLGAREGLLDEYDQVLIGANSKSIVAVERQVVAAIEEIERLKGRIRALEDRANNARIEVSFQFRDRAAPARDGSSSFTWLNTLNAQDVIWSHQQALPDHRTHGVTVPTPDGFSAWRKQGRYRAASPDGVLVRVRTEKHKPKAELGFWKEAVRERMVAAGYRVVAETDLAATGVAGAMIELAAPIGTEDWTYLVAFLPVGGRMVIAEAAGEITAFEPRRQAILASFAGLAP